jgi:hypothetical protein
LLHLDLPVSSTTLDPTAPQECWFYYRQFMAGAFGFSKVASFTFRQLSSKMQTAPFDADLM